MTQEAATASMVSPHGGQLVNVMADEARATELRKEALGLKSWDLTPRQLWDIELVLNGGFSPLQGFLARADYESVVNSMRLTDGLIWPMPIMLDVTEEFAAGLATGERVALLHPEGMVLAVITVEDVWTPDKAEEAQKVFGTTNEDHPGVFSLMRQTNPVYVGGKLEGVEMPVHHSYTGMRLTPAQLRARFAELNVSSVVAFQTRNPMHRAHVELTKRGAASTGSHLLIHPVVGITRPGDVDYYLRVRCYQAALRQYEPGSATLALLPLAMRMGGPREAVWHAIIRKNYGANSFIVGRDHAGPGSDSSGKPFYGPYDAQELLAKHEEELGVKMAAFEELVYDADEGAYFPVSEVPEQHSKMSLSGTDLRDRLATGADIPEWFSYPEVISELRKSYPPRAQQGITVFLTGLPSSGKSTIANVLMSRLMEIGTRPVTLLDGDLVRKHLSSELGFSKEHRDLNIQRIGYVASEITKNHGVAICAPIAPYQDVRRVVREMIAPQGGFIEVHVATPLEICEQRDRKGLYAKARAGIIKGFTGIDDPYEVPENPELRLDTTSFSADECADQVMDYLRKEGYV